MAGGRSPSGGDRFGRGGKGNRPPQARAQSGSTLLRFPTRRRRAWPRPPQIETVHPRILKRIAGIYADHLLLLGTKPARAYVYGLGWSKGLWKSLNPVIRAEIAARGFGVEED
jgi:hypothetical protein